MVSIWNAVIHYSYMHTVMLTRLVMPLIDDPLEPTLLTLDATLFPRLPTNNALLLGPPLRPNTELLPPQQLNFFGYKTYCKDLV